MRILKGTLAFALAIICCSCGVSARSVTVKPSSITFGNQAINTSSAPQSITITNESRKSISVSDINVQVSPSGIFTVAGWSASELPAGGSVTVQATFRPTAAQTYSGTINFSSNGISKQVAVSGTGTTNGSTVGIGINPSSATVKVGATQQFTASVTGTSNTAVTWSVNGVAGGSSSVGTVSTTGLYTAPATVPSGTIAVKATSVADSTKSASANVTVSAANAVAVGVAPKTASLQASQTQQFTATVTGTSNTAVTWAVNNFVGGNTTVGTISSSGLYTAPSTVTSSSTVTVTAQSVADTSKTASASVSLTPTTQNVSVTINPATATVASGATQQFAATVTGTTNTGVVWQVNGVTGGNSTTGTISSSGLYTGPTCSSNSGVTVTARSSASSTASANAQVTLTGGSAGAGHYYVSKSGSDSNDGSACRPWATISHAASSVSAGNVVHVASGTYNEQVLVSTSGTSSSHIKFVCDTFRACKVVGQNFNSSWGSGAFVLTGNYIDVMNFDITTSSTGTHGVLGYGSVAGYNIVGNYVHDIPAPGCTGNGGAGIDPAGSANVGAGHSLVSGNLVTNIGPSGCNRTHGIYTAGDGDTVVNNIVSNAQGQCISMYHIPRNQVVAFNTLDRCQNGGIIYGSDGTNGISSTGSVIVNNIITNSRSYGIQECCNASYIGSNTYDHNLIFNSGSACVMLKGSCSATVTGDPKYAVPGSDYHLLSGSAAIGTASTQAVPKTDYDGATRTAPNDIGAYRH